MKKLVFVLTLILAVMVSQTIFAQDTLVQKKVEKVVKVRKNINKEDKEKIKCTDKMKCSKDKKCCDKCQGDKCDGKCCAKCAKCIKASAAKCEQGKKDKCDMDSTAKCEKKDIKKHMEKKTVIKEKTEIEEKK